MEFDAEDPTDCVRTIHNAFSMEESALDAARERSRSFSWDESAKKIFEIFCFLREA